MTRINRFRIRPVSVTGQLTVEDLGYPTQHYSRTIDLTSTCADWHGRPLDPSPMDSTQYVDCITAAGVSYDPWNQNWKQTFDGYPVINGNSLNVTPLQPPNGWYLDVVAGTNPSRPVMNPPELLQDLLDIPKQLRDVMAIHNHPMSQLTNKGLSNNFLGVKFGWLPLVEDVLQLLELQKYVLKRTKELHNLYSGKGLRRRLRFGHETANGTTAEQWPAIMTYVIFNADELCIKRSWASITWRPFLPPPHNPTDPELNALARKLVLGLTPEGMARGAWNVIPWTWLIGWFTNIGKYTLAYSNTVPASHSEACFMSEVVHQVKPTTVTYTGNGHGTVRLHGERRMTHKTRIVSGALTPGFNMPFMDISRLSVLGALAFQRTSSLTSLNPRTR